MQGALGLAADEHSSMPTSKSKLNAVYPEGSATSNHWPCAVTSAATGAIKCMHAAALLQS